MSLSCCRRRARRAWCWSAMTRRRAPSQRSRPPTAASAPIQAARPTPAQLLGTIDWDKEPQIVSNGRRSGFPRVAVDSNNVTHVIYATLNGAIMYTNNIGGIFNLGGKALANSSYDTN